MSSYFWRDVHGQEELAGRMGAHQVEYALLELRQPLDSQVHVLEQHPVTGSRGRLDRLVCRVESLLRSFLSLSIYMYTQSYSICIDNLKR